MTNGTMVFGSATRRSEKWRVYRIGTANSTYELEVQGEVAGEGRRCAVLTCVAPPARAGVTFEDSAPRVGDGDLFALSPVEWMGKTLSVGTARTTEIRSVDFVKTASEVTRRTFVPPPPPAPPPPPPAYAPFPLGQIELLEAAAGALKAIAHRHDLRGAIAGTPHLVKRYQLALAECGLMLEALDRRD